MNQDVAKKGSNLYRPFTSTIIDIDQYIVDFLDFRGCVDLAATNKRFKKVVLYGKSANPTTFSKCSISTMNNVSDEGWVHESDYGVPFRFLYMSSVPWFEFIIRHLPFEHWACKKATSPFHSLEIYCISPDVLECIFAQDMVAVLKRVIHFAIQWGIDIDHDDWDRDDMLGLALGRGAIQCASHILTIDPFSYRNQEVECNYVEAAAKGGNHDCVRLAANMNASEILPVNAAVLWEMCFSHMDVGLVRLVKQSFPLEFTNDYKCVLTAIAWLTDEERILILREYFQDGLPSTYHTVYQLFQHVKDSLFYDDYDESSIDVAADLIYFYCKYLMCMKIPHEFVRFVSNIIDSRTRGRAIIKRMKNYNLHYQPRGVPTIPFRAC